MAKDTTSTPPQFPSRENMTEPARNVTLSLGDVGAYARAHNLRLRRIVDKDGTILYPEQ